MPTELENYITWGYSDGAYALSNLANAANKMINAADSIAAQDWPTAQTRLYECSAFFSYLGRYLLQDDVFYKGLRRDWKDALMWINDNWPSGAEVTMDAIVNAMFTASFNQLQKFIGLVDAYRMALWNAPFNAEWYASIARGFMQWP